MLVFTLLSCHIMEASSRMPRMKVIVNPSAGRGYAAKVAPRVRHCLDLLGIPHEVYFTRAPGDARRIAEQALNEGFETIVSVGGDGTAQEIVNGMIAGANGEPVGTFACVPVGSGNDFAVMNGVPEDIDEAVGMIAEGGIRSVDIGRITVDGRATRFFHNIVGIGFDGLVAREATRHQNVRGMALYLPAVLKTIFLTMHPMHSRIVLDGQETEQDTLMMIVSNGPREGHDFLIAPNSLCDDGLLDVILVGVMSRVEMLALVPRVMKGSHLSHRLVSEQRARKVEIASPDPMHFHVDGEVYYGAAHHIEIELLPRHLRMIGRPLNACPEDAVN